MRRVLMLLVRGYRRWLSPLLGAGKCRFEPSCSQYALEALEHHGACKGTALSTWRLLRCQPFCKGGYDPVPLKRSHTEDDGDDAVTSPQDSPS